MAYITPSFPANIWDGATGNNWRTGRGDSLNPDLEDWDRIVAEMIATQEKLHGDGGRGLPNGVGVAVQETGNGPVKRTVFTLTNLNVDTVDAGLNGAQGSHKLYDFPAGVIQVLGCTTDLTIARVGVSITATAAIVAAIGTVAPAADATLTGTEADIVPSTASTLTAGAGVTKGKSTAATMAAGVFDGTATAKDALLNFAMPDADHGATADALTVNGTITLTWINHGDN